MTEDEETMEMMRRPRIFSLPQDSKSFWSSCSPSNQRSLLISALLLPAKCKPQSWSPQNPCIHLASQNIKSWHLSLPPPQPNIPVLDHEQTVFLLGNKMKLLNLLNIPLPPPHLYLDHPSLCSSQEIHVYLRMNLLQGIFESQKETSESRRAMIFSHKRP